MEFALNPVAKTAVGITTFPNPHPRGLKETERRPGHGSTSFEFCVFTSSWHDWRMNSNRQLLITILFLLTFGVPLSHAARTNHFRISLDSKGTTSAGKQKFTVTAITQLDYTWIREAAERTLLLDRVGVRATMNGSKRGDYIMTKDRFVERSDTEPVDVQFVDANELLQEILRDSFASPICRLHIDSSGRVVKTEVVAGPGAKDLVSQGMIVNATLFHPRFVAGNGPWTSHLRMSIGDGGFTEGEATLKAIEKNGKRTEVSIEATLTRDLHQIPGKPISIRGVRHETKGRLIYDSSIGEWVAGQMQMEFSYKLESKDKVIGSAEGTIEFKFERLPDR